MLSWRLAEERLAGLVFGLDVEGAPGTAFDVHLEGARLEAADDGDGPESRLGLRLTARR